jgi:AcrR family transcriptional regulator
MHNDRKQALLDASIAYLLEHGVADLSLRPLAAAIDTSARLLIFHFGSKELLLADVLGEVQARLQRSFEALASEPENGSSPMRRFWDWAIARRNLPYLRLLYEVHFIALQNPAGYERYLAQSSLNWVELIAARLPLTLRSSGVATLCGAVFDGLLIELLGTGDRRRTTAALDAFVAMLRREHATALAAAAPMSAAPTRRTRQKKES